jgi:murein DD-endopeptidase MepM/ murein hydrolase activator NlpD
MRKPSASLHTVRLAYLSLGLLLVNLTACQPSRATPTGLPGHNPVSTIQPAAAASFSEPSATASATLVLAEGSQAGRAQQSMSTAYPSPAPDPLRLVFPTPAQPAASAWRPALYPTPWVPSIFDHFYFARPIAADQINWPLADYRYGGVFFPGVVHSGIDIPSPMGTPVLAAGPGKVTWAGYGLNTGTKDVTDPYGLAVLIRHDFGYQGFRLYTVYGHLSRLDVVKGQHVETGDVIGLSGNTGEATGPHLHFEVRLGKDDVFRTRNPELWLVPPEGWGVLVARVANLGGGLLYQQLVTVRSEENGQVWKVKTYGGDQVFSDDYYQENMVLSDLPAGRYEVLIAYLGKEYTLEIEIHPGLVSYFTFLGRSGYNVDPPHDPGADFTPSP